MQIKNVPADKLCLKHRIYNPHNIHKPSYSKNLKYFYTRQIKQNLTHCYASLIKILSRGMTRMMMMMVSRESNCTLELQRKTKRVLMYCSSCMGYSLEGTDHS